MKYSVALACYNGEKYILEQLESILNQTIPPDEIVISDDNSTDDTFKIITEISKNSKIKFQILKNINNHGVIGNFTNAIIHCSNEIIFTSDQDDIWNYKKAEIILNAFNSSDNILLVFSNGELVDENLNYLKTSIWDSVGINKYASKRGNWFNRCLNNYFVTGATMAFKKQLFLEALPIPSGWLHDGWLACIAAAKDGIYSCDEKLILYRQHSQNVVGLNWNISLNNKFRIWINNYKKIELIRNDAFNRYSQLYEYSKKNLSKECETEIEKCMSFWNSIKKITTQNRIKSILSISKRLLIGDYHKYYTGIRGYTRDLVIILITNFNRIQQHH